MQMANGTQKRKSITDRPDDGIVQLAASAYHKFENCGNIEIDAAFGKLKPHCLKTLKKQKIKGTWERSLIQCTRC